MSVRMYSFAIDSFEDASEVLVAPAVTLTDPVYRNYFIMENTVDLLTSRNSAI
jgi:hypothetical protein